MNFIELTEDVIRNLTSNVRYIWRGFNRKSIQPLPPVLLTENMFKSGRPIAQGEVLIWMKKYAPSRVLEMLNNGKMQPMNLENGQMILGHSETGHHHVLECVREDVPISKAAQALIDAANDTFIELKLAETCKLVHMRGNDTHGAFILPAGEYVRGLREEQAPEGWRRVAD